MGVWNPGPEPTENDDTFTGDDTAESENGLGGDDVMNGNGGDDTLTGGKGDDTLSGDAGNDTLIGGNGDDTIFDHGIAETVSIDGGKGNDLIDVIADQEGTIDGGEDEDDSDIDILFIGGGTSLVAFTITGIEQLHTNGHNVVATVDQFDAFDAIKFSAALPDSAIFLTLANSGTIDLSDELSSCAATVTTSSGGNTVTMGDFGDSVVGGDGVDIANGGDGNDTLNGNQNADTLTGGDGNDTLDGGAGNDTINGGAGNDTILDFGIGEVLSINAGSGSDTISVLADQSGTVAGGGGTDTLGVAGGTSIAAITITGIEKLFTGGHNIVGTVAQFDALNTVQFTALDATSAIVLTLADSGTIDLSDEVAGRAATVLTSAGGNTVTMGNLDDNVFGGAGADTANGGNGNDTLNGNGNDDTLTGGEGNDTLDGGAGNDTITGGAGSDTILDFGIAEVLSIDAGSGNDTITIVADQSGTIAGGGNTDTLAVAGGTSLAAIAITGVETLFTGGHNIVATAAQLEAFNTIQFTAADATSAVFLTVAGSGAVDLSDEIAGRAATVFANAAGNTVRTGNLGDGIVGAGGIDIFNGGKGDDTLTGADNNDRLTGGKGSDGIDGGTGADRLFGRQGHDLLAGGGDADRFSFVKIKDSKVAAAKRDVIGDFNHAAGDRIDVHKIDADTTLTGNQDFFLGGGTFTSTAGELIQVAGGGITVVSGDVDGDGHADFSIQLTGELALANADFVF